MVWRRWVYLVVAMVVAATACLAAVGEMRRFTDTTGRTILAELVGTSEQTVRIKREDGRIFEIEKSLLSPADQEYVAAWEWKRAFAAGDVELRVRRVRKESDFKVTKSSRRKDEHWCYRVSVVNGSRAHLDGLVAEWRVYYLDDTAGAKREKLPLKRKAGRAPLDPLAPGDETEFETALIKLQTTTLRSSGSSSGSSRQKVEDSLEGVWVRILKGDEVLAEHVSPKRLAKDEAW